MIEGLDRNGSQVTGASVSIKIVYSGTNRWPVGPVFINEWMANNASAIADSADGKFQSWFELYNAGDCPFDLSSYYLTDNLTNKTKWLIPPGTILPATGFLLVWADNETSQTSPYADLHANFQFNSSNP